MPQAVVRRLAESRSRRAAHRRARLADWTTLRLGGPAARCRGHRSTDELVDAVAAADAAGEPLLVLGGGSNLVVADEGFDGTVVRIATTRRRRWAATRAAAPTSWSRRARTGTRSWPGRSRRAGPASRRCPASPARSGRRRSRTSAPTARRSPRRSPRCAPTTGSSGVRATLANADCAFGYRHSLFKREPGRYVVGAVTLPVPPRDRGRRPVQYAELARTLGVEVGERVPAARRARGGAGAARAARAWCSTPRTTTPGARARSSPTRSSEPSDAARGRAGAGPQPRRVGQDLRGLADRARRASPRATATGRVASPPSTRSR